jgi:hypothetical protein
VLLFATIGVPQRDDALPAAARRPDYADQTIVQSAQGLDATLAIVAADVDPIVLQPLEHLATVPEFAAVLFQVFL